LESGGKQAKQLSLSLNTIQGGKSGFGETGNQKKLGKSGSDRVISIDWALPLNTSGEMVHIPWGSGTLPGGGLWVISTKKGTPNSPKSIIFSMASQKMKKYVFLI